jgi:hypothetical protein
MLGGVWWWCCCCCVGGGGAAQPQQQQLQHKGGMTQHKWPAGRKFMWSQSAPLSAHHQLHTTTTTTAGGNHPIAHRTLKK